ncbi:MAG: exopolyphosphatase, partial [Azonexus sp.]
MPGFSRKDQAQLATLVLGHRGKLDKLPQIPAGDPLWPLIFCLRLAALFCRAREEREQLPIEVAQQGKGFSVRLPAAWLEENPWTAAALSDETHLWRQVGRDFQVVAGK